MPLSKFETLPDVVIKEISLSLVAHSFLGPPTEVLPMFLLSRTISNRIPPRFLFPDIFAFKFDTCAATRRLGDSCGNAGELAGELVERFHTLKRFKNDGHAHLNDSELLRRDLWKVYLMFLESNGNNSRQLIEYAEVGRFASNYVSPGGILHAGMGVNNGWIIDNEHNALALWIFWFTDKARVQNETPTQRNSTLKALVQLFVGFFKYASTYAPITNFFISPRTRPPSPVPSPFPPLAASPVPPPCVVPHHFGLEITIARPLAVPPALLSCIARLEKLDTETFRSALLSQVPLTLATADRQLVEEYHAQLLANTLCVDWDDGEMNSERYEDDWMRLRTCYEPWCDPPMRDQVFTPGMLDGKWVGRWFVTATDEFEDMVERERTRQPAAAPRLPLVFHSPMQFHLREYHQHDPNEMVAFDDLSCDGVGSGVLNAWLPDEIAVNQAKMEPTTYRTYNHDPAVRIVMDDEPSNEHRGIYGRGIWDIILTAETDETFGEAWGRKRYYGRVRDWDGLVMLVREATESEGRWIFYGYVHGKQHLVGRWRETEASVEQAGWSGVWCMTKEGH